MALKEVKERNSSPKSSAKRSERVFDYALRERENFTAVAETPVVVETVEDSPLKQVPSARTFSDDQSEEMKASERVEAIDQLHVYKPMFNSPESVLTTGSYLDDEDNYGIDAIIQKQLR